MNRRNDCSKLLAQEQIQFVGVKNKIGGKLNKNKKKEKKEEKLFYLDETRDVTSWIYPPLQF